MVNQIKTWQFLNTYRTLHVPTGRVFVRDPIPTNSHFNIWTIEGVSGIHWATRKDALAWLEQQPNGGRV